MFNRFKKKSKVMVYGPSKAGRFYRNEVAIILERDSFFKDYHIKFKNGTDDWIDADFLRKPYTRKKKGVKK